MQPSKDDCIFLANNPNFGAKFAFELYSNVAQVCYASLVLRTTLCFAEPPRSNLRRLADKRALRLGCAALSAPPFALRTATQVAANLSFSAEIKIRHTRMSMPLILNSDLFLNSTPCEHRKLINFRALCALLRFYRNARGATLLASLESELSDSAALRYLRRRSL